eukprot:6185969-Pleurochrysis_carterae.AAC.2
MLKYGTATVVQEHCRTNDGKYRTCDGACRVLEAHYPLHKLSSYIMNKVQTGMRAEAMFAETIAQRHNACE